LVYGNGKLTDLSFIVEAVIALQLWLFTYLSIVLELISLDHWLYLFSGLLVCIGLYGYLPVLLNVV
jgi:hypothetical protein